ncbi:DUF397 domain-containing protein [Lentzea sp. NPDC060358]|uniref:DUF397 domain-containing protein n=1 Tax=Lentzea sp. NPDC060358 TaxID=3347103 RepID=UPI00365792C2
MNSGKTWRKSSYSEPDNNCVELSVGQHETDVRDSKNPGGGTFAVRASAWAAFLSATKSGGLRR